MRTAVVDGVHTAFVMEHRSYLAVAGSRQDSVRADFVERPHRNQNRRCFLYGTIVDRPFGALADVIPSTDGLPSLR